MRVNPLLLPPGTLAAAVALALALCGGAHDAWSRPGPPKGADLAAPKIVPVPQKPQAPAPAPPELTPVPAPAPASAAKAAKLDHDVPPREPGEEDEVPIEWVIKDGRLRHRPQVLSLDVGIWPDTFSLGAFWASPVLPRGFIRHVNDSFDLEFGLLVGAMRSNWYWADGSTSWQLWPAFGGRWNFFLTHNWTTFVTFKLAARIGLSGPSPGWFDVFAGAGASYRIKERMHLRLELNYPQGAVVGLSFPIGSL